MDPEVQSYSIRAQSCITSILNRFSWPSYVLTVLLGCLVHGAIMISSKCMISFLCSRYALFNRDELAMEMHLYCA